MHWTVAITHVNVTVRAGKMPLLRGPPAWDKPTTLGLARAAPAPISRFVRMRLTEGATLYV